MTDLSLVVYNSYFFYAKRCLDNSKRRSNMYNTATTFRHRHRFLSLSFPLSLSLTLSLSYT